MQGRDKKILNISEGEVDTFIDLLDPQVYFTKVVVLGQLHGLLKHYKTGGRHRVKKEHKQPQKGNIELLFMFTNLSAWGGKPINP